MIDLAKVAKTSVAGLVALFKRGQPDSQYLQDDWPAIPDGVNDHLSYRISQGLIAPPKAAPKTVKLETLGSEYFVETKYRDG